MTNNAINKQKHTEELYNYHFENIVKKDKNNKNYKYGVIQLKGLNHDASPLQKQLAIHFKSIKKKYSMSLEYYTMEDMIQEYSVLFISACHELEILEPLEELLNSPEQYNARLSYIKSYISREFNLLANPTSIVVNTREGNKYIDVKVDSIDRLVGQDEETLTISDCLTDENSLYTVRPAQHTHFTDWVLENKADILTNKQLGIFNQLTDIYVPLVDKTQQTLNKRNEMLKQIDMTSSKLNHMFKNINDRCIRKYEEAFDGVYHSHTTIRSEEYHEILNNYIHKANFPYYASAEERQRVLTNIVRDNYELEQFELLIVEGLSFEDKRNIVRSVNGKELITHKVLRMIRQNIENYLKVHQPLNVEASYPEYNYQENVFAGIGKVEAKSLSLTPSGVITYQDSNGDEKAI